MSDKQQELIELGYFPETDDSSQGLPPYRSKYMRDRDRIMYSRPFLRLAGKTQVYGTGYDDHARNRLTHSLEVAQIAKTITAALKLEHGSMLQLDSDLVEAIALGHDIGHTPFGHSGERKLDEILSYKDTAINKKLGIDNPCEHIQPILKNNSGFKHNWQSVRIVHDLTRNYSNFSMSLSPLTVSGILFHSSLKYKWQDTPPLFYLHRYVSNIMKHDKYVWSLEGLIVAMADEIAQRHHDIEDAISCHYLSTVKVLELLSNELDEIEKKDEFKNEQIPEGFNSILDEILKANNVTREEVCKVKDDADIFLQLISKYIVNWLITDCVKISNEQIGLIKACVADFNNISLIDMDYKYDNRIYKDLIKFSTNTAFADKVLQYRLKKIVLNSRNVQRMDKRGGFIIRKLVLAYITSPQQMPDKTLFSLFREYVKNFYGDMLGSIEHSNRYLFKDAADARIALDYCLNDKHSEIIFSKEFRVPFDRTKFNLSLLRVIADYISGMTDAYAEQEYRKLYAIDHDID